MKMWPMPRPLRSSSTAHQREGVDMTAREAVHHERRRQDHKPHILIGINTASRHQNRSWYCASRTEGLPKSRLVTGLLARGHHSRQCLGGYHRIGPISVRLIHDAACSAGNRDGVPVQAKIEWRNDRHLDLRGQVSMQWRRRQQMRPSNRPILSLSRTFDHDTSRTRVTSSPSAAVNLSGSDQRGCIDQRNKANRERCPGHFNNSAAVMID